VGTGLGRTRDPVGDDIVGSLPDPPHTTRLIQNPLWLNMIVSLTALPAQSVQLHSFFRHGRLTRIDTSHLGQLTE
jgi:hypothetical protein